MKDLSLFGTEAFPLRASGLGGLLKCPWRSVLRFLFEEEGESGEAADTGSATHVAVANMHLGKELPQCLEAMVARANEYPRADLQEAAAMFLNYSQDPRNKNAEVTHVEQRVRFQISPAKEDPTQAPIQVSGMLDQIRRVNGRPKLFDLKTSKKDGLTLLYEHVHQVAAYCVGASILLGEQVEPGALITPRKYRKDIATSPVFWHFAWGFKDIERILDGVRHMVAMIRSSVLWHVPGDYCQWCPMKSPDLCLPKLQQTLELRSRTTTSSIRHHEEAETSDQSIRLADQGRSKQSNSDPARPSPAGPSSAVP